MHKATMKALENAVAAVGGKLDGMTENWVEVSGVDFWNTDYGWVQAHEERDGSFSASVDRNYSRKTNCTGVVGRDINRVASSAGVRTYDTAAKAIRAHFG